MFIYLHLRMYMYATMSKMEMYKRYIHILTLGTSKTAVSLHEA